MLKNLFKPKWQHSKAEVRREALASLDINNAEQHRIVTSLAGSDPDAEVRLAACRRLRKPGDVFAVLAAEQQPANRVLMLAHLGQCLNESGTPPPANQQVGWLGSLAASELATLFRHVTQQDWCEVLLQQISDQQILLEMASQAATAQWRQRAAERVTDEAALEQLVRQSKAKDKGVYRIAKDRLDALRAEQKTVASLAQQAQDLCQQLEQLARAPIDPLYDARLEHLHKQWQRLISTSSDDVRARCQRALEMCRSHVQEARQRQQAEAQAEQQDRRAVEERIGACEQLEQALQELAAAPAVTADALPALNALLKTQALRWQQAHETVPAQVDERKRFEQAYRSLETALTGVQTFLERAAELQRRVEQALTLSQADTADAKEQQRTLQRILNGVDWPASLPRPALLARAEQAGKHLEQLGAERQAQWSQLRNELDTALQALRDACRQGHLKSAQKLLRDAQQLLQQLPDKQAADYPRQWRELAQEVGNLRDWQGFARTQETGTVCGDGSPDRSTA